MVDPLGGSYYIEALTDGIINESRKIINEVEELGGMAKAIETGMPKLRIEESAARKQARIDQGKDVIVGVNKYQAESDPDIDVLEIPTRIRDEQIVRLKEVKAQRDNRAVEKALEAITACAASDGNLLEACLPAVRARATVGEISDAMEKVFGQYKATTRCLSGVYTSEFGDSEMIDAVRKRTDEFLEKEGRRPRILVTKMGQDGHDRGVKVIATAYSDLGFDVDISPMFQTPDEAAKMAVENDVHIVGVSSLAASHKILVPELIEALKKEGGEDILVVVGGVIPPKDYDFLYDAGAVVVGIFGPGTPIIDSAKKILDVLEQKKMIFRDPSEYVQGVLKQDRRILSKPITLIESSLPSHQKLARIIIDHLLPYTGKGVRLGITGVPGVGKSCFIENFGMDLVKKDHRLAVLAIDPSSQRSGGSIMADKTRMEMLSLDDRAFIRPSPSGGTLGGVARKTRETMLLCEAAGFDVIIIETVGVGQSETTVASMVDFFFGPSVGRCRRSNPGNQKRDSGDR